MCTLKLAVRGANCKAQACAGQAHRFEDAKEVERDWVALQCVPLGMLLIRERFFDGMEERMTQKRRQRKNRPCALSLYRHLTSAYSCSLSPVAKKSCRSSSSLSRIITFAPASGSRYRMTHIS